MPGPQSPVSINGVFPSPTAGAAAASVATAETSVSTSYTDLATVGPSVTLITGTMVLISVGTESFNSGSSLSLTSYAVSGATTIAASDTNIMSFTSVSTETGSSLTKVLTGLSPGPNTFKVQYRVSAGTGTWERRWISVVPLN